MDERMNEQEKMLLERETGEPITIIWKAIIQREWEKMKNIFMSTAFSRYAR